MAGDADADRVRGDGARWRLGTGGQDQRVGTGKKLVHRRSNAIRHMRVARHVCHAGDVKREGLVRAAALERANLGHNGVIPRVAADPVDRVGGEDDRLSGFERVADGGRDARVLAVHDGRDHEQMKWMTSPSRTA